MPTCRARISDDVLDFAATGGYALKRYERYRRIVKTGEGLYRIRDKKAAQAYRMNVGTIVEAPALNVRLVSSKRKRGQGRKLGEMEEWFFEGLEIGDAFYFAGEDLAP